MKEIKFRAWDKEKEMMFPVRELRMFHEKPMVWSTTSDVGIPLQKVELMQYTGLKDKNGKEIYEGDVIIVFDEDIVPVTDEGQGPIEPCNHIVAVEMRNGVWGFEIPASDDGETGWYGLHQWIEEISNEGYEVIGNQFENPELLQP